MWIWDGKDLGRGVRETPTAPGHKPSTAQLGGSKIPWEIPHGSGQSKPFWRELLAWCCLQLFQHAAGIKASKMSLKKVDLGFFPFEYFLNNQRFLPLIDRN